MTTDEKTTLEVVVASLESLRGALDGLRSAVDDLAKDVRGNEQKVDRVCNEMTRVGFQADLLKHTVLETYNPLLEAMQQAAADARSAKDTAQAALAEMRLFRNEMRSAGYAITDAPVLRELKDPI